MLFCRISTPPVVITTSEDFNFASLHRQSQPIAETIDSPQIARGEKEGRAGVWQQAQQPTPDSSQAFSSFTLILDSEPAPAPPAQLFTSQGDQLEGLNDGDDDALRSTKPLADRDASSPTEDPADASLREDDEGNQDGEGGARDTAQEGETSAKTKVKNPRKPPLPLLPLPPPPLLTLVPSSHHAEFAPNKKGPTKPKIVAAGSGGAKKPNAKTADLKPKKF